MNKSQHKDFAVNKLGVSAAVYDEMNARNEAQIAARRAILEHIADTWNDYLPAECDITEIEFAEQFPRGAVAAGCALGDWVIVSDDGRCAEVVRIVDGRVESIFDKIG